MRAGKKSVSIFFFFIRKKFWKLFSIYFFCQDNISLSSRVRVRFNFSVHTKRQVHTVNCMLSSHVTLLTHLVFTVHEVLQNIFF